MPLTPSNNGKKATDINQKVQTFSRVDLSSDVCLSIVQVYDTPQLLLSISSREQLMFENQDIQSQNQDSHRHTIQHTIFAELN